MSVLQDMFEGILEHMGMSSDLKVVLNDCTDDEKPQSSATNRYSFNASGWPNSAVWTRCLGALDCLQVRYLQRPSDEHLFPALPASIKPPQNFTEPSQLTSPERPLSVPAQQTSPVHERSIFGGGNAVDAAQSCGAMAHSDDKVLRHPSFIQPGVDVASVLPSSRIDQGQRRSEAADSECSIM